jgi:hypothetical protein
MRIQKILFKILIGKNRWAKLGNIDFFNSKNLIYWISRIKSIMDHLLFSQEDL